MPVILTEENVSDRVRLITLQGTLDAPNAMAIEDEFKDLLVAHTDHVIVDLSGVDYMSSYGLRMLLIGAKSLRESGGNFYLASPNEHVSRVIAVAGYDTIFPVYHSVQEAIADLKT